MNNKPAYITWNEDGTGQDAAMAGLSRAYASSTQMVSRNHARADSSRYRNVASPNVSVRDEFNRDDYNYFRPGEQMPTSDRDVVAMAMQAYERFPIVKSTIDLMSDFAAKGVDVVHPSPRVQKFGKEWFDKVNGRERSERILSMLYRGGTTVIRRMTGKLPDKTMDVLRNRAVAADVKLTTPYRLPPNEIPLSYVIHDPRLLEVLGGELAPFVGKNAFQYGVRVPKSLAERLKRPKNAAEKALVAAIPTDVLNYALSAERLIPIPTNKAIALHYKKDDSAIWARPPIACLLDDLQMLEKLRMADRSALDGAISHIRVWKLGSLEHRVFPTEFAIQHLADMLSNFTAGGSSDLVWGPELELVETQTDRVSFLGSEKYQQTMSSIYAGLGVPPTLTGTAGEQGFTNNFVSLKVLIERLEYGRMLLQEFWEAELAILQSVFGFRQPFKIVFDIPTLTDDSAEKRLLIELVDRDLVSVELVQERFGADPEIEDVRIRRDARRRREGVLPPKAGPFHSDSRQNNLLEQAFVQQGVVTPSEVGLELELREPGEKTPQELSSENPQPVVDSGPVGLMTGRPPGAVDNSKRKRKRVKPTQAAANLLWADAALETLDDLLGPAFLKARGRTSFREATATEVDEFEKVKFAALCALTPGTTPTRATTKAFLSNPTAVPAHVQSILNKSIALHVKREGREPTMVQTRRLRASAVSLVY